VNFTSHCQPLAASIRKSSLVERIESVNLKYSNKQIENISHFPVLKMNSMLILADQGPTVVFQIKKDLIRPQADQILFNF